MTMENMWALTFLLGAYLALLSEGTRATGRHNGVV